MGRGGDDFYSPEVQLGAMRRVTAGMTVVGIIDDDIDQTGRTFSRVGIEKIRKLAEAGAIDAVAVYNISRFGRNVLESLQFLHWLTERGVTIISASEHIDTSTPSGRWMLTNLLAMAEMRSDEIGNEWRNTIHHRAEAGRPHGIPPTGYQRGDDGRLVPHPVYGPAVTAAFAHVADGGSIKSTGRLLRAATGLLMSGTAVRTILRNRTYLGEVRAGTARKEGAHEALVDEVTWQRVQAVLRVTSTTPSGLAEPKYALSGLLICGACGGSGNHRRADGGLIRAFCRRQADEGQCTGFGSPDAAKLEEAVLSKVRVQVANLRGNVGRAAAEKSEVRATGQVPALEKALADTRRAMVRAAEGWSRGRMDDRTYDEIMAGLERDEREQQAALDGVTVPAAAPPASEVVALAEKLLLLWPRMDGGQKNRALKDLVTSIHVLPVPRYSRVPAVDRIVIEWK